MKRTSMFKSRQIGSVRYDGCIMTYHQIGHVKAITCRKHGMAWEVATSLAEDTDKVWQRILAEAKAAKA